ncbi:MAG: chemotaxis protein CheX [Spirochaetia bacterium]|nr:chemotaxis protein CheX [Spirochaetia bacterium]
MDPFQDEKFILTVSSSFIEVSADWLDINMMREAYGQTNNEGLCYEFCASLGFKGDINGKIFIGMDGYTKLLVLPYIAAKFNLTQFHWEAAESSLLSYINQIGGKILTELEDYYKDFEIESPELFSNKFVPLSKDDYRKYTVIFFLKDDNLKKYLGRLYATIAFLK